MCQDSSVNIEQQLVEIGEMTVLFSAGTGKSYLINALRQSVLLECSGGVIDPQCPSVIVAAPTGVAAHNVDGITLHQLVR